MEENLSTSPVYGKQMTIETMKHQFKNTMRDWLFADGVVPDQVILRYIWRSWFMATVETMRSHPMRAMEGRKLLQEAIGLGMEDDSWWPDRSFHWWED